MNIHKPRGPSSRDVVNRVQWLIKPHKAGHAGTLDPLATGVLIVCVGSATRLIQYVQRMPKRYRAIFQLGRQSDTEDITGAVVELPSPPQPTREEVRGVLPAFVGWIEQIPPAYSALKVSGRRSYDLARRGRAPELAARKIEVRGIELIHYEYPELTLDVRCGSGTYIRSLGRDIARALGTEAVMAELLRSEIGPFRDVDALPHGALSPETIAQHLAPPQLALGVIPQITVTDDEAAKIINGVAIEDRWHLAAAEVAASMSTGRLLSILIPHWPGKLKSHLFFPPP